MSDAVEYNYQEDLAIDPDNLHEEWLKQPSLYMKYAEALARAERKVKNLDHDKKIKRSQLINKKREEETKASDKKCEAYYRSHDDYIDIENNLIEAQYQRDLLQNAVYSFGHRKKALEGMAQLYASQYYAGPKEPKQIKGGKRFVDMALEENVAEQRSSLNNGRRRRGK